MLRWSSCKIVINNHNHKIAILRNNAKIVTMKIQLCGTISLLYKNEKCYLCHKDKIFHEISKQKCNFKIYSDLIESEIVKCNSNSKIKNKILDPFAFSVLLCVFKCFNLYI